MDKATESTNINGSLFKEKVKRITLIQKKIDLVDKNIKSQIVENEKTQYFITYLNDYYLKQKDQLEHFNKEKAKLQTEYYRLSDEINLLQSDLEEDEIETIELVGLDSILNVQNVPKDTSSNSNRKRKSDSIIDSVSHKVAKSNDNFTVSDEVNQGENISKSINKDKTPLSNDAQHTSSITSPYVSTSDNNNLTDPLSKSIAGSTQKTVNANNTLSKASVDTFNFIDISSDKEENENNTNSATNDNGKEKKRKLKRFLPAVPTSSATIVTTDNSTTSKPTQTAMATKTVNVAGRPSTTLQTTSTIPNILATSSNLPNSSSINLTNYKSQILSDQKTLKSTKKSTHEQSLIQIQFNTSSSELVAEISKTYTINQIISNKFGVSICGNKGLLMNIDNNKLSYYQGHSKKNINKIYQINDSIVSMSSNLVLIHKVKVPNSMKQLAHFPVPISCSVTYKSLLYIAVTNRDLYVVDLSKAQILPHPHFFKVPITAMTVVKCSNKTFMVIAQTDGEVNCLDFETNPIKFKSLGHIPSEAKGMVSDSGCIICYTENRLFIIEKNTWLMNELRELSHKIMCLAFDVNNLVLADSRKNLHRYIIKNGRVGVGSTIESLESVCDQEISAINLQFTLKKIILAADNQILSFKL